MKKGIFTLTVLSLLFSQASTAEYMIKVPLEQAQGGSLPNSSISIKSEWIESPTVYGDWIDQGHPYECNNWLPANSTITIGETFSQTATDCSQVQTRTAQSKQVERISGKIRDSGEPYIETKTITVSSTRDAIGNLETWVATEPTYTNWVNNGNVTGCSNWSPATSTYNVGVQFTQTATDCKQDQERTKQDREQETTTLAIRNLGSAITENQTITISSTRQATGTKPVEVCLYVTGASGSLFSYSGYFDYSSMKSYYSWSFKFQGSTIKSGTGQYPSSVTSGSYIYTIGATMDYYEYEDDWGGSYQICRKPL